MLRDILTELASLFPSKYIHIGGDEVSTKYWSNCPRCKALMQTEGMRKVSEIQSYFVRRLETIVRETGKSCAAWNEVLEDNRPDKSTLIYAWKDTAACAEAVRAGQPVVMMPAQYCYIDMKQSRWERGHTWAWLVDTRRVYSFDPDDTGIGGAVRNWSSASRRPNGRNCSTVPNVSWSIKGIPASARWPRRAGPKREDATGTISTPG